MQRKKKLIVALDETRLIKFEYTGIIIWFFNIKIYKFNESSILCFTIKLFEKNTLTLDNNL